MNGLSIRWRHSVLPADSGFHVGPSSANGNFFWIDVHFENDSKDHVSAGASVDLSLRSASDVPRNLGIKYMHKNDFLLPPKTDYKDVCVTCTVELSAEIVAYRNHAHLASRLIYAEQYRDDAWVSTFGRRSTADAQIFYPIENGRVMLLPGDEVDVHCIYNTSMRDTQTGVGLAAKTHEMCNQYLMYTLPHDKLSAKDPFTCRFTENCKSRPRVSYLPTSSFHKSPQHTIRNFLVTLEQLRALLPRRMVTCTFLQEEEIHLPRGP